MQAMTVQVQPTSFHGKWGLIRLPCDRSQTALRYFLKSEVNTWYQTRGRHSICTTKNDFQPTNTYGKVLQSCPQSSYQYLSVTRAP